MVRQFSSRDGYGALKGPTPAEAILNRLVVDPRFLGQIGHEIRLTVKHIYVVSSRIAALLSCRRPPYVSRLIVTIYLDAVERVFRGWSRPNVVKECLKGRLPLRTHADAPTAVVLPRAEARISAPVKSLLPCAMLGSTPVPDRLAVCRAAPARLDIPEAPARRGVTRPQIACPNYGFGTAIAATEPHDGPENRGFTAKDKQMAETLSCVVDNIWHEGI